MQKYFELLFLSIRYFGTLTVDLQIQSPWKKVYAYCHFLTFLNYGSELSFM